MPSGFFKIKKNGIEQIVEIVDADARKEIGSLKDELETLKSIVEELSGGTITPPEESSIASYWMSNYNGAKNWLASKSGVKGIIVTDTHYGANGNFEHSQAIRSAKLIQNELSDVYFIHLGDMTQDYEDATKAQTQWNMFLADNVEENKSRNLLITGNHEGRIHDNDVFTLMEDVTPINTNYGWYKTIDDIVFVGFNNARQSETYLRNVISEIPSSKYVVLLTHWTPDDVDSSWTLNSDQNELHDVCMTIGDRFIGHWTGHQHVDRFHRYSNGVEFVTFCCDKFENNPYYADYTYDNRVKSTVNEGCFTCFNIDTANNTVEFKRFGASTKYNEVSYKDWSYDWTSTDGVDSEPDEPITPEPPEDDTNNLLDLTANKVVAYNGAEVETLSKDSIRVYASNTTKYAYTFIPNLEKGATYQISCESVTDAYNGTGKGKIGIYQNNGANYENDSNYGASALTQGGFGWTGTPATFTASTDYGVILYIYNGTYNGLKVEKA